MRNVRPPIHPGSHPIAAPITVMINGPMAPITILSGDGSAILSRGRVGNVDSGSARCRYGSLAPTGSNGGGGPRGKLSAVGAIV
jgi:hypothetical protein